MHERRTIPKMGVFSSIRGSRLFHLLSDLSVLHWLVTLILPTIAGLWGIMHGRPLDDIVLRFTLVLALALVVCHYGLIAWHKVFPERPDSDKHHNPSLKVMIPIGAVMILVAAWMVWPRFRTPSTQPTAANQTSDGGKSQTKNESPSVAPLHPPAGKTAKAPNIPADKKLSTGKTQIPTVSQRAGSAFSINQQGGVTAGIYITGVPPKHHRHIPAADRNHLVAILSREPGYVEMRLVIGDAEVIEYAGEWKSILEDAHWKVENVGGFMAVRPWAGIKFEFTGGHITGPTTLIGPMALIYQAAIGSGLRAEEIGVDGSPNQEKGKILMYIAPSEVPN